MKGGKRKKEEESVQLHDLRDSSSIRCNVILLKSAVHCVLFFLVVFEYTCLVGLG